MDNRDKYINDKSFIASKKAYQDYYYCYKNIDKILEKNDVICGLFINFIKFLNF